MSDSIKRILEEYIKGLIAVAGKNLKQVILYGSYARGDYKNEKEQSDIDIMILVEASEEEIKSIQKKVLDYSYDIDLKYNVLLSPIVESVKNYNDRVKYMQFYKNIEDEGVLLNG